MKRFLHSMMLLAVMLLPLASIAQTSWTVADGTTTHAKVPLDFYNCDGSGNKQAQMLYPASLLTDMNGATIASITFYHQNSSATKTLSASTWYIRMGETTETDLSTGFSSASLTTVYSGNLVVTQGVVTFEFSTPYTYNGGNLVVEIQTTGVTGNWFGSMNQGFVGVDAIGSTYSNMSSPAHTAFLPKTVFAEAPTCFPVTDLTIGQATTSSLTLTWADADNASASYDIYNMADTSLVASSISGTTYTVDNLNANTGYAFAVVANCGGGDLAAAVTVSGRTACDEMVLPYFNDFEGEVNGSSSNDNSFVFCWTRTITNRGAYYYPYVSSTGGKNSPKCLYFTSGSSTYSYSDLSLAVLPQVTANYQMSNLRMSFWAMTSTGDRPIYVGVMTDPTDAATLVYVDTIMVNTTWGLYTSYFANYAGEGTYVAFAQPRYTDPNSSYATATIYVDEVTLEEVPSCVEPSQPVLSAAAHTVSASWTANGNESVWDLQYKAAADSVWTDVAGLTATSYTITDLQPLTTYQVRVRANCAADDQSGWSTAASATTLCTNEVLPYEASYDNFESCWARYSGDLAGVLAGTANLSTTSGGWVTNTNVWNETHYKMNMYSTGKYWMVTPSVEISSANAVLSFDAAVTGYNNGNAYSTMNDGDRFVVLATTDNGTTWTPIMGFGGEGEQTVASIPNTGATYTVSLGQFDGDVVRIAFYGALSSSGPDYDLHVHNILMEEPPTCPRPTDFTVTATTATTATMTWSAGATESAWQIQYKLVSDSVWTLVDAAIIDTFYTLTGLNHTSDYEVQLRAYCSASDQSPWVSTSFATECGAAELPWNGDLTNGINRCWSRYTGLLADVMAGTAQLTTSSSWALNTNPVIAGQHLKGNIYGSTWKHWVVTPTVHITGDATLSFEAAYMKYSSGNTIAAPDTNGVDDRFVVLMTTDDSSWTILREYSFDSNAYASMLDIDMNGETITIPVNGLTDANVRFAFYGESTVGNADNDMHIGNISVAAAAPQIDTIEVVADYYNSGYYAADNDWYIQIANDDYNFNFDIVADSIVSGHTYTLADMLAEYSDGNDLNNYDVINYAAVSYTQTTVVDTLSVNAFVTATTGNVYHITYSEVIDRTIDTIDINMGLFESDVFDGQYIVDMAPADTSMVFEFVFDAAPVDGVTYTMADMEARGMSHITYEYIMPTQATYVQNTVNNVFTVEATMLDGNKFYQLHYSANAGTPTTDTIDVVATNRTEMYFAEDNDWYIKLENDDYDFYFDIVADSLVSGQTYTLADMLTDYSYGTDYNTYDDIVYAAASYTQTVVGDTMNVNAFVTATTGDVYHITYFEIIDRTIDTIDVNMAVYVPLDNGEDYFVDLANADTTIVFEFTFAGAPVNGVTYTMDDMDAIGVDYIAYANIYPTEATYVQNQANGMFTIEATALAGRKFYQLHYAAAATDPTPDSVNINVVAADTTMGTVTGSGRYEVGENVTISAIANEGYHFVAWNDQDTNATRVIVADTMDMTFTATFAADPVVADSANITVVAADTTMGTVTGSGRYEVGETITITAVANAGYEFVSWNDGSWNDGNTDATRTIVVEGDATYIATFRALEGINDAEATAAIIYTMDNNIVVKNAANQNVYVFDVTGRCVAQDLNNAEIRTFAIRNAGVYLVKVGNAVAKRVVIVK